MRPTDKLFMNAWPVGERAVRGAVRERNLRPRFASRLRTRGNLPRQQEATDWFARLTTAPTDKQKAAYNRYVYGMKKDGLWSETDAIAVVIPGNSQTFVLNMKGNVFNLTMTGTLTGPDANGIYYGASGAYFSVTGLNLSTAVGINATQNDFSVNYWPLGTGNANYLGGTGNVRMPGITENTSAGGKFGTLANFRIGDTSTATSNKALQPNDLWCLTRPSSGTRQIYCGGTLISQTSTASAAFDSVTFQLLNNNNIGNTANTAGLGYWSIGKARTLRKHFAERRHVRQLLIDLGVVSDTSQELTNGSNFFGFGGDTWQTQSQGRTVANDGYSSFRKDGSKIVFDVRPGDHWPSDPTSPYNRQRSELLGSSRWGISADVWISFSALLPSTCDTITGDKFLLYVQAHADDAISGAPPPFAIVLNDLSTFTYERHRVKRVWDTSASNPPNITIDNQYLTDGPAPRSQVFSWVIRLRFKTDGTAVLQAWLNGVLVYNMTAGDMGYGADISAGAYMKMGIYRSENTTDRSVVEIHNYQVSTSDLSEYITDPLPLAA